MNRRGRERRSRPRPAPVELRTPYALAEIVADPFRPAARTLVLDGREHALTAMEYRLVDALVGAPGRVFSRTELMGLLDDAGALESFDRAIDSHISRLRTKIEIDARNPRHLITVRGMGYRFLW